MTEIANLVIWEKIFERYRRIVLSAGVIEVCSRIQREGDVVHLVAIGWLTCRPISPASVMPHSVGAWPGR